MNKRQFLKTSSALFASNALSTLLPADEIQPPGHNWSGNYQFRAKQVHIPESVTEAQAVIRKSKTVKAVGARHSFNSIADTAGDQVSLQKLGGMEIDRHAHTATVGAGVKYGQVAPYLYKNGYALHNLASLPHIEVVGACATATHGSGVKNGNLSTAVAAIEYIKADGELVQLSRERNAQEFPAAVVALGGLGVATRITLNLQPAFDVSQVVYENLPFDVLEHHLEEVFSSGYSVSIFTDWQNHRATQVWVKSRVEKGSSARKAAPEFFGAKLATRNLHPLAGHSAENCTEQMGVPGPWYERLPHFRMNFTPSSGAELQSEYFVAREDGFRAISAVEKLRDHITPHLFITELRTIDADDLWMSTAYRRPSMAIHFTWKLEWPAVEKVLPMIEQQLAPFDARPHWAKLFTMQPSVLQSRYKQLAAFRELLRSYDPGGKFRNEFLERNILVS